MKVADILKALGFQKSWTDFSKLLRISRFLKEQHLTAGRGP
jgi:hypothetical protein